MERIHRQVNQKGKSSPGPRLIKSLKSLHDSLQNGEGVSKYTRRTVELQLNPREYGPDDVRKVRDLLRTSQGIFAKLLGVSIKTVQAWEQGNSPPPMARRLLDTIEQNPEPWEKMLREAAVPT